MPYKRPCKPPQGLTSPSPSKSDLPKPLQRRGCCIVGNRDGLNGLGILDGLDILGGLGNLDTLDTLDILGILGGLGILGNLGGLGIIDGIECGCYSIETFQIWCGCSELIC